MSSSDCGSSCQMANAWTNSKLKVDKVTYMWTIDDFDFREAAGDVLKSPTFSAVMNDEVEWFVALFPNGHDETNDQDEPIENSTSTCNNEDTVGVFVYLSELSKRRHVFAKFTVSILNKELKKVSSRSSSTVRSFKLEDPDKKTGRGWKRFCKKDESFRTTKLSSNNQLILLCEITFSLFHGAETIIHHQCTASTFQLNVSKWNRSDNFSPALNNRKFSDVVVSVKGTDFPAHKVILAARSPVFAAMFQHDTKETQLNRVDIDDMDVDVAEKMLGFIYSGECEDLDGLTERLLVAADKYDVEQLRVTCVKALSASLSVENAANILVLADMHSANELKTDAIKFIVAKSDEVLDTPGWRSVLSRSHLVDEVFRAIISQNRVVKSTPSPSSLSQCTFSTMQFGIPGLRR